MINILTTNKNGVELVVQTIYTIREPSKFYKKDDPTPLNFPYVVKGTFSHPEPAWNEFFRITKNSKKKKS